MNEDLRYILQYYFPDFRIQVVAGIVRMYSAYFKENLKEHTYTRFRYYFVIDERVPLIMQIRDSLTSNYSLITYDISNLPGFVI